ncbi:cytochrome c biogenesis protein CcdA [Alicyclobacillus tolerans]|uniref:cytochrome c biogenesis CcdA family protein n=1 Tax=Alicyclobacillus tolerans TaxID=90970 RepID=UPI001F458815|nr:cytochrome c biogenesis protein CcdA [Alicyclobacillus tolerans]MCF8566159.1 cytochrome c biogenesis protein CcdA [Alicyclobacillus tolerans]
MTETAVPIWIAFGAGILSFVSPCTLPLFPSYIGYISGVSFHSMSANPNLVTRQVRVRAFSHALFFGIGLSFLFIVLGWGATAFGHFLVQYRTTVRLVGGALIIVMGLFMAGVLKSEWLMRERRFQLPASKPLGYLGSVLVGVAFAAGWTPCIGPILASVLALVIANPGVGSWYMVAYALGFVVPFLVLAWTLASIRPLLKYTERIAKIGGWLLVLMGLLLVSNKMVLITIWIQRTTGFTGF